MIYAISFQLIIIIAQLGIIVGLLWARLGR